MEFQSDPESPPDNFICPITLEVMKNPVKDPITRRSFERRAIVAWLESSGLCPMTRRPMEPEELVSDKDLKKQIREWKQKRQEGTNPANCQERKDGPRSSHDHLLDIRRRVLAKRDERIACEKEIVSQDTLCESNTSTQHQVSLGCLLAQSLTCRSSHEKPLQSFGINQEEEFGLLYQPSSSKRKIRFVSGHNKKLSSRLSDVLSIAVDEILEEG